MMAKNLFEELTTIQMQAIAMILGFNIIDLNDIVHVGFRNRLRDISAFNRPFTMGDALDRYLSHMQNRQSRLG